MGSVDSPLPMAASLRNGKVYRGAFINTQNRLEKMLTKTRIVHN
jgi:hypothetical protein